MCWLALKPIRLEPVERERKREERERKERREREEEREIEREREQAEREREESQGVEEESVTHHMPPESLCVMYARTETSLEGAGKKEGEM